MELKLIIVIGVLIALYFIAKNYKHEEFHNIDTTKKQDLKGDLLEHEAGLLVALLAKVAKADGNVSDLEAQMLGHTFTDIASHFNNAEQIREQLKNIYTQEKESFNNTMTICQKYFKLTRFDYAKRLRVMEYLLNMAFIDGDFSKAEQMITEDIAKALEIKEADYANLIHKFHSFYTQRANEKVNSLTKAYETLESKAEDDFETIKQNYRRLVKIHHPDIVRGKGGDESIIEIATRRLQEINEAYEIIKKDKNV